MTESILQLQAQLNALDFPTGPRIAEYLGLKSQPSRKNSKTDEHTQNLFRQHFMAYSDLKPIDDTTQLVESLEELVAMEFGDLALNLANKNKQLGASSDFRGLLALGTAAMLEGELQIAEDMLLQAHELAPEEIAPYTNLASIYFHNQNDQLAEEWARAGLIHEKNNRRLWEVLGLVFQVKYAEECGPILKETAVAQDSWAGVSLAALLTNADDPQLRAEWLGEFYAQGERDQEFLIEYTAVLGTASEFEMIPLIVHQLEALSKDPLSWQLYVHAAQALLAQDKPQEAAEFCKRALEIPMLKESVRNHIFTLIDETEVFNQKNKLDS